MAVTVVTPVALVINTFSTSQTDSAGCIVPTNATDGWTISVGAKGVVEKLILKFVTAAGGDTFTINKATLPPGLQAPLGNLTQTGTNGQVFYIVCEGQRVGSAAGLITVTCTDTGSKCGAFLMPDGIGGGTGIS